MKRTKIDLFALYERAVQGADFEIDFLTRTYKRLSTDPNPLSRPLHLREDFCGTALVCCEWVKQGSKFRATGVDLSTEALEYSRVHHVGKLSLEQKKRLRLNCHDVRIEKANSFDVITAQNFSYFIFKARSEIKKYFRSVLKSLKSDGIFVMDIFGGFDSQKVFTERKRIGRLSYLWECHSFNPINHHAQFSIHFRLPKKPLLRHAFTYDWRMWSLPEIEDLLREVGFDRVEVCWEGDDGQGGGNGRFVPRARAENCDSWVAYIVATPPKTKSKKRPIR